MRTALLYVETGAAHPAKVLQSAAVNVAGPSDRPSHEANPPSCLPLLPLLRAYANAGLPSADDFRRLPALGPRFDAIRSARDGLLSEAFLDGASADDFQSASAPFL